MLEAFTCELGAAGRGEALRMANVTSGGGVDRYQEGSGTKVLVFRGMAPTGDSEVVARGSCVTLRIAAP